MSGEVSLSALLQTLSAKLAPETFVFVTQKHLSLPDGLVPRMMFQEAEGTTLILEQSQAEAHGFDYEFPCRMITLDVHSALEAVGFIARISTALADANMGVNPVAGFYHDHLFVPLGREDDAMQILAEIANKAAEEA